jgi:DNA polymerase
MEELGIDRKSYYIANVVKCRPPGNRDPKPDEIQACSPWLNEQLNIIKPKVIITVGNFATRTILKTTEGITKLRGHVHRVGNQLIVPTFHPAAALRGGDEVVAKMRADLVRAKKVIAGDLSEVLA